MVNFFLPQEFIPLMDSHVCQPGVQFGITESFFYISGWASVAGLALLASVFLVVFRYLLALVFQNPQATAEIKLELYELVVTFAIFAVLFMLLNGMCSIRAGWIFPEVPTAWASKSIYYAATNYLLEFADDVLQIMALQYRLYSAIDFITSMELSAVPMGIGATMKPTAGLGAVIKPVLNNAFTAELIGVVTTQAQIYVLDYGTYGLLKYFLPLGLIFRNFSLTRKIGGTIIALTLVFIFIYPLLIIPTYQIVNTSLQSHIAYFKNAIQAGIIGITTPFWLALEFMFKYLWGPDFVLLYSLLVMPLVAKIFLGAVFMPLFNTLILVTTARYLSRMLGEEIDITNLTRMI